MPEIIAAALCGLAVGFVVGRRARADPAPVAAPVADPDVWVPDRAERAANRPAKSRTCSPHQWQIPAPDDGGLVCTECGRYLEWAEFESEPYILESIMGALRRRRGAEYADRFAAAVSSASGGALNPGAAR